MVKLSGQPIKALLVVPGFLPSTQEQGLIQVAKELFVYLALQALIEVDYYLVFICFNGYLL